VSFTYYTVDNRIDEQSLELRRRRRPRRALDAETTLPVFLARLPRRGSTRLRPRALVIFLRARGYRVVGTDRAQMRPRRARREADVPLFFFHADTMRLEDAAPAP